MILYVLLFSFWSVLIVYVLWFFFKAKTVQPLTLDDLALTWKVHKQQTGCTSSRIHGLIKENEEVIGFTCDCGYEFIQKRLITQRPVERNVTIDKMQKQLPNVPKDLEKIYP